VLRRSYDLGLIIPSRDEFDCARQILAFEQPVNESGYYLHPFTVPDSDVTGIAVVLFDLGLAGTAIAATTLLERFELRMLALIGVAGALDGKLGIGDVIIASSIDEFLHAAKATSTGDEFEVGGNSWTASRDIVNYANNFRYLSGGFDTWKQRAIVRRPLSVSSPDYQVGRIASGDVRGDAKQFSQWLLRHNRLRAALEMEAGGAAQAVYRSGRADLLVIRGISNFADGRELDQATRESWRHDAALNAVDLLAAMVTNPNFPWPTPRTAPPAPAPSATAPPVNSTGHVFISHAEDDTAAADRLRTALMGASVKVWDDTADLLPGQDRRSAIRKAISDGAFVFLACFSSASLARTRSRHNEELTLAIYELRQRRFDRAWLIPVKLDDCEIPDIDIGGGRTLRSLVSIDLFGPKLADQTQRLIKAVLLILGQS
jgi:nucleoside phosphorylase